MGEVRCFLKNCKKWHNTHTNTQTDGHRDFETESAQWAEASQNQTLNCSLSRIFPTALSPVEYLIAPLAGYTLETFPL